MKALLLEGPNRLQLRELGRPSLSQGQVRVRVRNVGVCGSDYSSIAGKLSLTRYPIVPGHEASGEVIESLGKTTWKPGDRVLIHPILVDRSDPHFARGDLHHSLSTEVLGVITRNGAYAQEVVVEDYMLRPMPADLDYESAAMVEPVAVAVRAVTQGALHKGDRALVLGAGNIGLLVIQVSRILGADRVVVTDLVQSRLDLALKLGADEAISVKDGFPRDALEGRFDVVIDGIGSNETVQDRLTACDRGGRIVVYGVPEGDVSYRLKVAYWNDVTLATSRLYNSNFDLPLKLVAERKVRVKDIITHRVRLDEAPALIHRILSREEEAIKVMICPSQD